MAETPSRQTRSNSLQRMLDLEKQYMVSAPRFRQQPPDSLAKAPRLQNERLRAAPTQVQQPFHSASYQQRPSTRGRQVEAQSVQERRQSENRQRSFPLQTQPQKPQLVIDVNSASARTPITDTRDSPINMKIRRTSKNIAASPPSIPYSSTVEAFPTPVSGNPSSVCQSPSWEAYDRRKQEKKEEKKAKEEAKASRRPRRLSKAPPASSPQAFNHINSNGSEPAIMGNTKTTRPASMVIGDSPSKDAGFYKQPRSRAGSFSSLFGFRRSSIDQSQEPEFIGGIKLEFEQHLANERNSAQSSAVEETELHPALRKASSNSPLKSPPPPPRPNPKGANSRAYPPNTFQTAKSKSLSLVSPTAPALPDLTTIEKWRTRVGLKSKSSPPTSTPAQSPQPKASAPIPKSATWSAATNVQDTRTERLNTDEKAAKSSNETGKEGRVEKVSRNSEPVRKTPPPPEPPRRSSKRNSVLSGSPSMPLLNAALLRAPLETAASSVYDLPATAADEAAKQPSASPSWENLQSSVMNTIEQTVKPMGDAQKEQSEKTFWNSQEWPLYRSDFPHLTSSSEDDSASDCFNTVSMPSTPNTSRPQSEKGTSRCSGEADRLTLPRIELHDNAYPSENCSFVSASSFTGAYDTDREADPIRAAARKVMAALPPMPSAKPETGSFEHEPLRLRSKFTDTSSISDSSVMEVAKLAPKSNKTQPGKRANGDPIAKVFVECCGCKYYHDMPSKLYDAMVNPNVVLSPKDRSDFAGAISMTVNCPWCKHAMSTNCCAGLAAMVYVKERLH